MSAGNADGQHRCHESRHENVAEDASSETCSWWILWHRHELTCITSVANIINLAYYIYIYIYIYMYVCVAVTFLLKWHLGGVSLQQKGNSLWEIPTVWSDTLGGEGEVSLQAKGNSLGVNNLDYLNFNFVPPTINFHSIYAIKINSVTILNSWHRLSILITINGSRSCRLSLQIRDTDY